MINRQTFVVRGKKRRKKSEVGKRHVRLFLPGRRAYPPSSFSISPPSNHATMSKY
ncbi:hypothetical protein [Aneurinibacillus migulanus]|uniref:hypothetical protein n=1 Tax=Aneurinibacillus migulanus TaxID=47500 RepID=UPI001F16F923|nr:hypothetical protein [Aneurinibacillus migulanus]